MCGQKQAGQRDKGVCVWRLWGRVPETASCDRYGVKRLGQRRWRMTGQDGLREVASYAALVRVAGARRRSEPKRPPRGRGAGIDKSSRVVTSSSWNPAYGTQPGLVCAAGTGQLAESRSHCHGSVL